MTEPGLLARARACFTDGDGWVDAIIPTFNRKEILLERAVPSALAQTYGKVRVIVVVHGSADGTVEAVARLRNPNIHILYCPRTRLYPPTAMNHWLCGPTEPLNVGLGYSTGDWIARMDDDDIWRPDHISRLISWATAGNHEFVSAAHLANGQKVSPYVMPDGTRIGGCQTWVYRSYLKFFRYNPDSWRKSWNRNNDTDLQHRMWKAGVRMGYYPIPTVRIDPRPGQTHVGSKAYLSDASNIEAAYRF